MTSMYKQVSDHNLVNGMVENIGPYSPLMASSFVRKLYYLVSANEHHHIIGWVRDGLAFEVRNPKLMESEILPKFFRHSRFQSFVRQLNFYAFKKISRERSSWIYSHEYFRKDKPELWKWMYCRGRRVFFE